MTRARATAREARRRVAATWRARPPETAAIGAVVVVLLVILYGGGRLIGLPLPLPGLSSPTADVHLDRGIPAITRSPDLRLTGSTQAGASVTVLVDHVKAYTAFTGPDGRFVLPLTLPKLGEHRIRIEVRYGRPRIEELLESTIRWVDEAVATPRILAVEWWAESGGYYLLIDATPGVRITPKDADLEPLSGDRVGPTGRAAFVIKTDGTKKPTLTATQDENGQSFQSPPTKPLDLPALAEAPPPVDPAERVDASVVFTIDRRDVTRTWTARLDPHRVELGSLTSGDIEGRTFLEDVTGPAGIAPLGSTGCLVGTIRSGQSDLEIGDTATLTLVDSFPGVITQWNGFTDSPGLSLCMPRGMPSRRDTGFVEVRLRDFVFDSVSIQPTSATTETAHDGTVERVYRWDRIPFATNLDLRFGPAAPSILSLVPTLGPSAEGDRADGRTRFLDALLWRFLGSLGTLSLLAIVTSRLGAGLGARRAPVRNVLVVGLAFGLASAFPRLDLAAASFSNFPALLGIQDPIVRRTVAEWLLTGLVIVVGGLILWWARWRHRAFWEAVASALILAGVGWLVLTLVGRGALGLAPAASSGKFRPEWVRLAAWISSLLVLVVPMTYLWATVGRLADPARPRRTRGRLALWVATAAVASALLSIPAGIDGKIDAEAVWPWMRGTFGNVADLAAFVAPLAAFVLMVNLVRRAWETTAWYDIELPLQHASADAPRTGVRPPRHLVPALASAIFAGFAITTGGGLQPFSFAAALAVFAFWLRPAAASEADAAKRRRQEKEGPFVATPPVPVVATPPVVVDTTPAVDALPTRRSIWSNVRFALICGVVFLVLPLALYIAQYPISGVSRADPLYLQHVLVTLGSFSLSWLFVALSFGLGFEHLHGKTGLRKGLLLGLAILLVTVPFQALYGIFTVFSPLELAIWVFDVVAFTTLLGAAFDLREANSKEPLDFFDPKAVLGKLSASGVPAVAAGLGVVLATIATTIGGLITNQLVQIVTQVVTPFLPLASK